MAKKNRQADAAADDGPAMDGDAPGAAAAAASPDIAARKKTTDGPDGDAEDGKAGSQTSYETRLRALSPIAHPLAGKKLTKKVYRAVRKAAKVKSVRRGVKEVVKALRKGQKGVVVIAGDISPIDVITHIPILCEENNVPYCYVPSKEDLGYAGVTKRPTSCVMIQVKDDIKALYEEINGEVKDMNERLISTV
ncbi:hypothetical protein SeMB42_g03978 [Synchytrium endobioticum]|uniref:H/ACA ribonucleoprotein complex subunit 2 n=1 Tax=Synchytrium endobioticum TaxID=286115 RepID=A0A507CNN1_9FUNG|nr:hypothetical protein SeLEV6574_g06433 [Synchytrium endobioticum]TPX45490.1 hypothetical protein SeMB42_g03978 [Synchytrium endobioticum]